MVRPAPQRRITKSDDIHKECTRNAGEETKHEIPAGTEHYTLAKVNGRYECQSHTLDKGELDDVLKDDLWVNNKVGSSHQRVELNQDGTSGKITFLRKT